MSRASAGRLLAVAVAVAALAPSGPAAAQAATTPDDPPTAETPAPAEETEPAAGSEPGPLMAEAEPEDPAPVAEPVEEEARSETADVEVEAVGAPTEPPADGSEPEPHDAPAEPAAPRSVADRYVDALAGTWAATGILAGGLGGLSTLLGLAAGCAFDGGVGCALGATGGSIFGASLGWIVGPAVGASLGAGLAFEEGLAVWAMGLGTNVAVFGFGLLIGHAVDETQHTWGLGRVWGMITGLSLGALAQVFLTPLYAVLLFDEREPPAGESTVALQLFAAPSDRGALAGVRGVF